MSWATGCNIVQTLGLPCLHLLMHYIGNFHNSALLWKKHGSQSHPSSCHSWEKVFSAQLQRPKKFTSLICTFACEGTPGIPAVPSRSRGSAYLLLVPTWKCEQEGVMAQVGAGHRPKTKIQAHRTMSVYFSPGWLLARAPRLQFSTLTLWSTPQHKVNLLPRRQGAVMWRFRFFFNVLYKTCAKIIFWIILNIADCL